MDLKVLLGILLIATGAFSAGSFAVHFNCRFIYDWYQWFGLSRN